MNTRSTPAQCMRFSFLIAALATGVAAQAEAIREFVNNGGTYRSGGYAKPAIMLFHDINIELESIIRSLQEGGGQCPIDSQKMEHLSCAEHRFRTGKELR